MNKSLFTRDELQELRKEFVEFKINEMTMEDMASYLYDIMINDVSILNEEELRYEIDSYDESTQVNYLDFLEECAHASTDAVSG